MPSAVDVAFSYSFKVDSALLGDRLAAPLAARVHLVRARAYVAKNDPTNAKAVRDEALRQDPGNREAQGLRVP